MAAKLFTVKNVLVFSSINYMSVPSIEQGGWAGGGGGRILLTWLVHMAVCALHSFIVHFIVPSRLGGFP